MNLKVRARLLVWTGILLCCCYVLPNHYAPWLSVHQELGAALAFIPLLLWASISFSAVPPLAFGAAAMSLVPLMQVVTGQLSYSTDGWMGALYLMGFALAIHAGSHCVDRTEIIKKTELTPLIQPWMGLILAALISVGIEIYQWLMLGNRGIYIAEMPPNGRPFGNLAQPNQLATLLLLGMAGLMFLWEAGKLRANIALSAAMMLAFGLVMTGSRSVLLTLVWLVPVYSLMKRRCHLRTSPAAIAALIGFYLISSYSWSSINTLLLIASDANTAVERMADPGIRKVFWLSMVDAISRAPWAGYGWGQIGIAQTITALEYPATYSIFDSSHNLFLDIALWGGVPLACLVAIALVLWFGWQIRQCHDPLSFSLLIAVGVVFSHAMVEYPLYYAYFLLPVGLWMGALSAVHPFIGHHFKFTLSPSVLRGMVVTLSGGFLILFVMVAAEYFPFEEDWRLMRFQEARIGNLEPTEPPPAIILHSLHEFLRLARTEVKPGMTPQDIDAMHRISERYGYAITMYRYAVTQALNNDTLGAQQTLRRLCKMQTKSACRDAQNQWASLTYLRYPALPVVAFPVVEVESEP